MLDSYSHFFFVGIAGTGMSAIAQYLNGIGKKVSGSDRLFGQEQNHVQRHRVLQRHTLDLWQQYEINRNTRYKEFHLRNKKERHRFNGFSLKRGEIVLYAKIGRYIFN